MSTRILVPDRELEDWKSSDPRGYAAWFKSRSLSLRMDKAAAIEPLPSIQNANAKTVLQRVVQLLKRARDRFVTNLELSPRSIVLTTLAGHGYGGQVTTAGAMSAVLQYLRNLTTSMPPRVFNPVNGAELLSEQWEKNVSAYFEFKRWLDWFISEWSSVMEAYRMPDLQKRLAVLFGEEVANAAIKKHAQHMDDLRKAGDLKVRANGALVSAWGAAAVRPNTFYGDE